MSNSLQTYLTEKLLLKLPGKKAHLEAAPFRRIEYAEKELRESKKSAVLILFYQKENESHIVLIQRPKYDGVHSGQVALPGGKVEEGEDHKFALARELKEELELEAEVNDYVTTLEHAYPDFSIKMHCFIVHLDQFDGKLKEHKRFAHVSLTDADKLDWIEADRPVLQILKKRFTHVFTG